ncbi:MAG: ribosome biogenesis GTPase Der [Alphaproteobacteria bacterium CG_4_9_14_3_um_filter_47_13]|nr:MAG: ribosome biogenesis GTPase Der [Alphaproteobacteria bacterium CG_4_9_14_3_um_filter_47_13]
MFTLAIVGRPNVGKSTLFNRFAGKQLAIVDDTPGVTRDWREAEGVFFDQTIRIIDTAGLEESFDDSIRGRMRKQTEAALKQADVILFLVDGRSGITPLDKHFAGWLRKQNLPVILGVNKCENDKITQSCNAEAYGLGLGEPVAISAAHGLGIENIYYLLKPHFPLEEDMISEEDDPDLFSEDSLDALENNPDFDFATIAEEIDVRKPVKIAIVGRPNVGKSTLVNTLVGEERVMTGPEAGITRDAIAIDWVYKDRKFKLVDTAGLRRKAKVMDKIEKMSAEDSKRAIRLAQVIILVLDSNAILDKQDLQIAEHVIEEGRALVIAVNKWDAVENREEALEKLQYKLETSFAQVRDIPTVTISALKNRNIDKLMDAALDIYEVWNRRVSTAPMNRWLASMESQHPAPLVQGRPNRLKYITQIKNRPPTFALWVSRPKEIPAAYKRYIINNIRKDFDLPGVAVRLLVRASKNPYSK